MKEGPRTPGRRKSQQTVIGAAAKGSQSVCTLGRPSKVYGGASYHMVLRIHLQGRGQTVWLAYFRVDRTRETDDRLVRNVMKDQSRLRT